MRVVVLAGGRSSEHPVSLDSGRSVQEGLQRAGHDVRAVVIGRDGVWRENGDVVSITPGRGVLDAEVVFPVLHGPFGEDGTVQGLLETADVPYVGAGVMGSAVCMDKVTFKHLMAHEGMPQVRYEAVPERDWEQRRDAVLDALGGLGLPVFVKPARLGSSVGISKVTEPGGLVAAVESALAHDPVAIVEAAAAGIEVECSVMGTDQPEVSEPGQVIANADWYDYESKYTAGGMELVVPAPISAAQRERVRRIAQEAFLRSACSGLARVDFFVTDEGQVLLNELNTIPGFTSTSVFARLFEASGVSYEELLNRLLGYAVERYERARAHSF
ncbi:MAG TPA: D-alanine--D-alanine ligase family protein [Solirubrobacterales bacterium]|nr:D-alanine--D-alanine ligase family protein [Solirubrobacterales bacterium]